MGIIFICITGLFMIIHAVSGIYPFGTKSNMLWDQDIQYVDYFAFYQDVLLGKAHLGYSFSKSMGGSLMALFGYYLGCPLNLFVVFFPKALIPLFLFILNTVKLGLAGITTDFFLSRRFPVLSLRIRILLSVSYGLMQYVMIQSSNIMWLDGVILLPLLLWNVYRFVTDKKKTGLFITVLLSIAINWYTGYMTGIFAGCYFLYERILSIPETGEKGEWKKVIAEWCSGELFYFLSDRKRAAEWERSVQSVNFCTGCQWILFRHIQRLCTGQCRADRFLVLWPACVGTGSVLFYIGQDTR